MRPARRLTDRHGTSAAHTLEAALLLLLPVALFFAYRVSPMNQVGFVDPWVYWGYIHNFEDLHARYGPTYYSVRFGLIFPSWLLQAVLSPIPGYYAFCYAMYLVAGVPLYLLVRCRYSVAAAVSAYTLMVTSLWLARSILWTATPPRVSRRTCSPRPEFSCSSTQAIAFASISW